MPRLDKVYLSQSEVHELEEEFYRRYDKDYWNIKIGMYDYLLENIEDVFDDQEEFLEDYRRLVKAEFVYMFYHSTEALLGLIRSLTKNGIPWIDLKETYSGDIGSFVENEMQEENFNDELRDVFYPGVHPDETPERKVEESVEVIWEYLERAGSIYDDLTVYNEYKHGLRLVTRETDFEIDIQDGVLGDEDVSKYDDIERTEDGLVWTGLTGDILFYLDASLWKREDGNGTKYWSLSEKMQSLEFELYRRLCGFNADLINQIFSMRCNHEESTIMLWDDIDLQEMLRPRSPFRELSLYSYHPRGEDDVLEYEVR